MWNDGRSLLYRAWSLMGISLAFKFIQVLWVSEEGLHYFNKKEYTLDWWYRTEWRFKAFEHALESKSQTCHKSITLSNNRRAIGEWVWKCNIIEWTIKYSNKRIESHQMFPTIPVTMTQTRQMRSFEHSRFW